MKCSMCGGIMRPTGTDLPFITAAHTIAILKDIPVLQCERCPEHLVDDSIMARVDTMLTGIDSSVELTVIHYPA
ncbi:MAG TPA: YgiT-type zinc finger protein [Terriglobales bacterium]|nr:YgiT-type zinc finger protein [Terriglobales bacterium]